MLRFLSIYFSFLGKSGRGIPTYCHLLPALPTFERSPLGFPGRGMMFKLT